MSETMADHLIDEHTDAIASGDECPECSYPINDEPGCQCDEYKCQSTWGDECSDSDCPDHSLNARLLK
jgi:hypothetical protein